METFQFTLLLEDDKGLTTKQNVIASDSIAAVNDNVPGTWCKMDKNDIPRGIYGVGTYSYKNGYVLVKKPNGFCDWFRRIHG